MADYWGLQAIAQRMDCHPQTVASLYRNQLFPMLKRRQVGAARRGPRAQVTWYTNDELLTRWFASRIAAQRRMNSIAQPLDRRIGGEMHDDSDTPNQPANHPIASQPARYQRPQRVVSKARQA